MIWWILFGLVYFGIGAFCGSAALTIGFKPGRPYPAKGLQFFKLFLKFENAKIFAFFFFLWVPFFVWTAAVTAIARRRQNKQLNASAND